MAANDNWLATWAQDAAALDLLAQYCGWLILAEVEPDAYGAYTLELCDELGRVVLEANELVALAAMLVNAYQRRCEALSSHYVGPTSAWYATLYRRAFGDACTFHG